MLCNDEESGGIFSFDDIDKTNISKVNFRGDKNKEDKAIEMIAYQLELAYDLAICVNDNISVSGGFEPLLGATV